MGHSKKRKHNQETPIPEDEIKQEQSDYENNYSQQQYAERPQEFNRKARIIVRNLSFKSTEEKMKEYFEQFGPVDEVKLLKRPDGKLVGCGFVQYKVTQNAAKAIFNASGKPFLGRDIICDWALGKSTYIRNMQAEIKHEKPDYSEVIEVKEEEKDDEKKPEIPDIKMEPLDENEKVDITTKSDNSHVLIDDESSGDEEQSKEDFEDSKQSKEDFEDDKQSEEDFDDDEHSEEDFDDEQSDEDFDDESQISKEPEAKRLKVESNDVQEGKTIFIKNVPFRATNNDVRQCMQRFGPVYYALVCMDKFTEHSKGTAFVKFVNQEDAEKCLEAGTELTLMGQVLDCHRAVSKNELEKGKEKKEVKKDSRNLYLIKEGVILAGSRAAQSVSETDMAKRLELERWKTQILRNLNMFISRNRLIIHNLPATYDDKQLRDLFTRYSGPTAVIKEAKVMKDFRNVDVEGKPVSKEYGFVSFSEHEDALRALRVLNNNPSIFTRAKRPIVAFSIENKSVMNARNKRLIKSKLNNPTSKEFNPNANKEISDNNQKNNRNKKIRKRDIPENGVFTGVTAKPGQVNKMRSKYKLTTQAQIHHETLKKEKKKLKLTRKVLKKRKEDYLKQNKHKKNKPKKKKNKDDNFTKIIDKYRKSNVKSSKSKKRKWYET